MKKGTNALRDRRSTSERIARWDNAPRDLRGEKSEADQLLDDDTSLLDIVDHVLTKGVVVTGDLLLGVADIDLVYLRVSAVLCAADRILPNARSKKRSKRGPSIAKRLVGRK